MLQFFEVTARAVSFFGHILGQCKEWFSILTQTLRVATATIKTWYRLRRGEKVFHDRARHQAWCSRWNDWICHSELGCNRSGSLGVHPRGGNGVGQTRHSAVYHINYFCQRIGTHVHLELLRAYLIPYCAQYLCGANACAQCLGLGRPRQMGARRAKLRQIFANQHINDLWGPWLQT